MTEGEGGGGLVFYIVDSRHQSIDGTGSCEVACSGLDGGVTSVLTGDEQFEIADTRSFDDMYGDLEGEGMQPVTNDYVYVG